MTKYPDAIELWKSALEKASKELLESALTGKDVSYTATQIVLTIPNPLYDAVFEGVGKDTEKADIIFGQMASYGLQQAITGQFTRIPMQGPSMGTKPPADDPVGILKAQGLNLDGLESKLKQLQDLVTKVQNVQETFDHAVSRVESTMDLPDKENPK